ncbi:hypothetical protein P3342_001493 [Pyrenophora teres f. teres]|nr:hypothetical protein P3342_001493 [Pyrenophora teres f. teres]
MSPPVEPTALNAMETNAISLRNQQESPLLRLPSELRNMIYAYTFGNTTIRITREKRHSCCHGHPSQNPGGIAWKGNRIFGITQVCRELRSEIGLMPFEMAIFYNTSCFYWPEFLNGLSVDQVGAITHIQIPQSFAVWLPQVRFPRRHNYGFDKLCGLKDILLEDDEQFPWGDMNLNDIFACYRAVEGCLKHRTVKMIFRKCKGGDIVAQHTIEQDRRLIGTEV